MTDVHDSWAAVLIDDEPDYEADAPPIELSAGEVAALADADGHLAHLKVLRQRRAQVIDVCNAEIERLTHRRDELVARIDSRIEWHERPVTSLQRALLERDGKRMTVHVGNGTLRSRAGRALVEYFDERAFVAWARQHHGSLVRSTTEYAPNKDVVKKRLKPHPASGAWRDDGTMDDETFPLLDAAGEIVPGVRFKPARRNFTIELDGVDG